MSLAVAGLDAWLFVFWFFWFFVINRPKIESIGEIIAIDIVINDFLFYGCRVKFWVIVLGFVDFRGQLPLQLLDDSLLDFGFQVFKVDVDQH